MATQDLRIRIALDDSGKIQAQLAGVSRGFQGVGRAAEVASTGGLKSLSTGFQVLGSALPALGAGAAIAGLVSIGKQAFETAGSLQDAADRTGFGVEALQEYGFAAEQVGVSQAALEQSLGAFTRNVGKAREGTGTLVSALRENNEELLISVASANSMEQALDLVLQAIERESDAAGRAALATAAFGKSGAQLLPILSNGVSGLDEMRQRAHDLGLVLSAELVSSGDAAGDRLGELGTVIRGNLNRALLEAAPLIEDTATGLTDLAVSGVNALTKLNSAIGETRRIVANTIELETNYGSVDAAAERLAHLRSELDKLAARPRQDLSTGEAQGLRDMQVEVQRLQELLGLVPPLLATIGEGSKKALGGIADEDIPGVQRGFDALRGDVEKLGGTFDGLPSKLDPLVVAIGDVKPLDVIDNDIFAKQIGEAVKLVKDFSTGIPKVKVEIDEAFVRDNAGKIRDFIEKFPESIPAETRQVLIELLADDTRLKTGLQHLHAEISAFTRDVQAGAVGAVEAVDAALGAMWDRFNATNAAAERLILFGGRGIRNQVNEVTGLGKGGAFAFPDPERARAELERLTAAGDVEGIRGFKASLDETISGFRPTTSFTDPWGKFVITQQAMLGDVAEEAKRALGRLGFREGETPIAGRPRKGPDNDLSREFDRLVASVGTRARGRIYGPSDPSLGEYNPDFPATPVATLEEARAYRRDDLTLTNRIVVGIENLTRVAQAGTDENRRMRESISRGDVAAAIASQASDRILIGLGRQGFRK